MSAHARSGNITELSPTTIIVLSLICCRFEARALERQCDGVPKIAGTGAQPESTALLQTRGQRRACFDASAMVCGSSQLNELAIETCGVWTADKCQRRIELGSKDLKHVTSPYFAC